MKIDHITNRIANALEVACGLDDVCDCDHFKHCKGCEFDGVLGLRDEPCRSCKDGSNHWVDESGGEKC